MELFRGLRKEERRTALEQKRDERQTALRAVLIVIAIAALLAIAWCSWYLVQYYRGAKQGQDVQDLGMRDTPIIDMTAMPEFVTIPVDFEALQEMNPDICAWITIPGTAVNYPVVHREGDDAFYMNHSSDGAYYSGGSIYSEDCNATDFTDPMTVLYGHNLRNGTMFHQLNDFADVTVFTEHPNIYVYLPDRALVYVIFSVGPHSNEHLIANHDYTDREDFEKFYSDLKETRAMSAQFRDDQFPVFGKDRVLVLSTCFRGDNHQRFLVMGRLVAEIPAKS